MESQSYSSPRPKFGTDFDSPAGRWVKRPPDLCEVREALDCVVGDTDRAGQIVDRIRDRIKKELDALGDAAGASDCSTSGNFSADPLSAKLGRLIECPLSGKADI